MTKKDLAELKKHYGPNTQSFDKITGCYVNSEKEKIAKFTTSPLQLENDELFKYLDIAKKCLSGRIGNNVQMLEFAPGEEPDGEVYSLLRKLQQTALKDEDVLDEFYDRVIDSYDSSENLLILLFHDNYDIPMKASDGAGLDESEIIFDHILCAVCPVKLPKGALGYVEDEQRIGELQRNETVCPVETAFMFPAYSDHSPDYGYVITYSKDAKAPHTEFFSQMLDVKTKMTSAQKLSAFENMIIEAEPDNEKLGDIMPDVMNGLSILISDKKEQDPETDFVDIDVSDIQEICEDAGLEESQVKKITDAYSDAFPDDKDRPDADELLDNRFLKDQRLRSKYKALQREVTRLNRAISGGDKTVNVTVPEDSKDDSRIMDVDGIKCLVIPVGNDIPVTVNGKGIR